MKNRFQSRQRRKARVRKKVSGTPERPRLNVFRSLKHIYVQAIDDVSGSTLASASSRIAELPAVETGDDMTHKCKLAKQVGKLVAQQLSEKGISTAVFDRSGYLYHGRVQALADGAREGGIKI